MSLAIFPKMIGLTYTITKSPIAGRTLTQESVSGKEFRLAMWAKGSNRHQITLDFAFLGARQVYGAASQIPVAAATIVPALNLANDFDALRGFFLEMQGSFTEFLLDPVDEDPAVQAQFGTTDGSSTVFQLSRNIGGHSEIIQNVNGTPILPSYSWTAGDSATVNDIVIPSNTACYLQGGRAGYVQQNGWPYYLLCTRTSGVMGTVEPNWRSLQLVGQTIADGGVTQWTLQGVPFVVYVNGSAVDPSTYTLGPTGLVTFSSGVSTPGQVIAWTGAYYYRCRFMQDQNQFDEFMNNFYEAKKVELISIKL